MVYKVLVVGSGGHAKNFWRSQIHIHDAFEVVGVVDIDTELLEHAGQDWGIDEDAVAPSIEVAMQLGIEADVV